MEATVGNVMSALAILADRTITGSRRVWAHRIIETHHKSLDSLRAAV